MKKFSRFLLLSFVLGLTILCLSCVGSSQPVDTETTIKKLFDDFSNRTCVRLVGYVESDETHQKIDATVDRDNKAIRLFIDGTEYLYYGKFLFKKEGDSYVVMSTEETFVSYLKTFAFSAFYFSYNKDDCENTYLTDNHIIVTFGGIGVKNSFGSSQKISGGVFTVAFSDGKILSTHLTTTLNDRLYVVRYAYSDGEPFETNVPVHPTDGTPYLTYVTPRLVDANDGKTLYLTTGSKSTGATIADLLPTGANEYITLKDVENAFVIPVDDTATLTIVYKSAKTVLGLSSAMNEVAIAYRLTDNVVTLVTVNNGLRYTLQ